MKGKVQFNYHGSRVKYKYSINENLLKEKRNYLYFNGFWEIIRYTIGFSKELSEAEILFNKEFLEGEKIVVEKLILKLKPKIKNIENKFL
ncbi:hypothetical protein AUJ61_01130 [Candidatus Pacearchaeota archaeon CG1_02_30_18]|nr:hypothetical protein [Candidatus Pacearchaeota archaeon]OIO40800.1 MAG: hypothetical protein AUJ61_01130 [Candidatus Pacearchaeota archaeon CG1_02_30_18]PIN71666.1 MAG: hypothetical protein COV77_00785 [Candidatus Pacearchaeota archaeon CG11_big_fil_rev_8_21_14_0_20_30_13]PIZ82191.1 MAG: hypothetical protein COX98_00725 [Candidatus Pacearchaeota archaeon CG_4_10_14_0_2_um_filter_30_11]PJA71684.1 MAG: hypothetical protein CO153_00315 [Candidatus Pacearchaeota archaeon CG_4_9_14_3_um_filter_30